jgi:hypothetical protein
MSDEEDFDIPLQESARSSFNRSAWRSVGFHYCFASNPSTQQPHRPIGHSAESFFMSWARPIRQMEERLATKNRVRMFLTK